MIMHDPRLLVYDNVIVAPFVILVVVSEGVNEKGQKQTRQSPSNPELIGETSRTWHSYCQNGVVIINQSPNSTDACWCGGSLLEIES